MMTKKGQLVYSMEWEEEHFTAQKTIIFSHLNYHKNITVEIRINPLVVIKIKAVNGLV